MENFSTRRGTKGYRQSSIFGSSAYPARYSTSRFLAVIGFVALGVSLFTWVLYYLKS